MHQLEITIHSANKKILIFDLERDRIWSLSRELLCIATFDGHFKEVNPAWKAALGLTIEELTSKPFIDFVHPEDRRPSDSRAWAK